MWLGPGVRRLALTVGANVLAVAALSCNLSAGVSVDVGPGDSDGADGAGGDGAARDGADVPGDEGALDEASCGGGSLTMVATSIEVLDVPVCDLDDDGTDDSAIAALGTVSAAIFASGLNSLLQASIANGARLVAHLPWVDQPSIPETEDAVVIVMDAVATEDVPYPEDDFSGDQTYFSRYVSLDACGEPASVLTKARIVDGVLSASGGAVMVPLENATRFDLLHASATGTIGPSGSGSETVLCGYLSSADASRMLAPDIDANFTILELLVAGGALLGVPSVAGLTPDVDVDGDGLERFEVDDAGTIVGCVDGDRTVIAGEDCAEDERIVDGFSVAFRVRWVGARFAGLQPGWERAFPEGCEHPPETSLWDPP